jgi:hypothetical protein
MQLEHIMNQHRVEIPFDEEGADRPMVKNFDSNSHNDATRKYTPFETFHIGGEEEDDDVPLQLLTADEKVEELSSVIGHKDNEIEDLMMQL